MKRNTLLTMMLVAAAVSSSPLQTTKPQYTEPTKPDNEYPPMPKGYEKYYFDKDGEFLRYPYSSQASEVVYQTIAQNRKKAKKKFDKWNSLPEKDRPKTIIKYR